VSSDQKESTRLRGDFEQLPRRQALDPEDLASGCFPDREASSNRRRNLSVHKEILELGKPLSPQHLEAVSRSPVPEEHREANGLGVQTFPSRDSNGQGIGATRRLQAPLHGSIPEHLGAAGLQSGLHTLGRVPPGKFTPDESTSGIPFEVDPWGDGDALPPPEAFQLVEAHVVSQFPELLAQHPTLDGRGQGRKRGTIRISTPGVCLIREVFRLVAQKLGGATQHPTDAGIELLFQERQQFVSDPVAQEGSIGVGGVLPEGEALARREPEELLAMAPQQGSDQREFPSVGELERSGTPPGHASESLASSTPEQAEQQQLRLVVGMMGRRHRADSLLGGCGCEESVTQATRHHLEGFLGTLEGFADPKGANMTPDSKVLARHLDQCRVGIGFGSTKPVIRVGDHEVEPRTPSPGQNMEKNHRIQSTRHRHHEPSILGQELVLIQLRSDLAWEIRHGFRLMGRASTGEPRENRAGNRHRLTSPLGACSGSS